MEKKDLLLKGGPKKIELPIEEIVEKYENGTSTAKLADEYGTAYNTINNRLKEYYKKIGRERPIIKSGPKKIELPIEEIVEKYENGTTIANLAEEYETTYDIINNRIKEFYKENGKKVPRILKSSNIIVEYLKRGITIEKIIEIASKKNVIIPQDLIDTLHNNKDITSDEGR